MASIEEPITPGRHLRAQSLLEADISLISLHEDCHVQSSS